MKHPGEGMTGGVSVRYIQDKISNCLSARHDYINFFMVLNEIKEGLSNHSLITHKDQISRYLTCVELSIKKLDEILKAEVQRALVGDEDAIVRLCANYIDNVMAYMSKAKVKNKITGRDEPPDERLMRNIESRIKIPDQGADDFRRTIAAFIGDLAHKKQEFKWDSNPLLKKALEAKLYEDTKDHIKLSALNVSGATVVQPDLQEKIDAIKTRLIKQYGYNEQSASDVLDYVGSIFARGDLAEKD
jgi:serine protein kinase